MTAIDFLGATQTVTGSKYLLTLQTPEKPLKVLVDCGLFQGPKALRLKNWAPLPVPAQEIDAVILTHAHVDHCGYLPLLVKQGFRGKIYATASTRQLCSLLLPDSGHLQEEEAAYANRHHFSKHSPALPLYTQEEALEALSYFHDVEFHQTVMLSGAASETGAHFYFGRAGHILGAAFVHVTDGARTLLFSGDLGRPHDAIICPPDPAPQADYLVIESTYGDRKHEPEDPFVQLAQIVNRTIKRGGVVVIPSFAVGRAQSVLYALSELKRTGQIPDVPVYLNSPMAVSVTHIFNEAQSQHRLTKAQCEGMFSVAHMVNSVEESKALNEKKEPMIIISASGMATGGRVLHHIKAFGPDARNTLLFIGYQAQGTRGASIVEGAPFVKMLGEQVAIRAEVCSLHNISAHADYSEMNDWLSTIQTPPRKVFITHGELGAAQNLQRIVEAREGWHCEIPGYLQHVELT